MLPSISSATGLFLDGLLVFFWPYFLFICFFFLLGFVSGDESRTGCLSASSAILIELPVCGAWVARFPIPIPPPPPPPPALATHVAAFPGPDFRDGNDDEPAGIIGRYPFIWEPLVDRDWPSLSIRSHSAKSAPNPLPQRRPSSSKTRRASSINRTNSTRSFFLFLLFSFFLLVLEVDSILSRLEKGSRPEMIREQKKILCKST